MSNLAQEEAAHFFRNQDQHTSHPEDLLDPDSHSISSAHSSEHNQTGTTDAHSDPGDDQDTLHTMTSLASSTVTYHLPRTHYDANTGPKGVITDAQSFNQAKKSSFRKTLSAFTNHAQLHFTPPSRGRKVSPLAPEDNSASPHPGSTELGVSDEEDFMRQWRENRLQELSNKSSAAQRRQSPSKRSWGTFDEVDATGYLDAVEKVGGEVVVVVCIYDPEVCGHALSPIEFRPPRSNPDAICSPRRASP